MSVPLSKKKIEPHYVSPASTGTQSGTQQPLPNSTLTVNNNVGTSTVDVKVAVVDLTFDTISWGWFCNKCGSHNIIPNRYSMKHQRRKALLMAGEHGQKHGAWRIGVDSIRRGNKG